MAVHIGNVGTVLQFTITDNSAPINLTGLTIQLVLIKPSGITLTVVPTFTTNGSDGQVQYVTQGNDIDEAGYWQYQAIILSTGSRYLSDIGTFEVLPNVLGWQLELVLLLRNMIADIAIPYMYSDNRLKQVILTGAQLMQGEVYFTQTYAINIALGLIDPDPTINVRNDSFVNLAVLKAACIIDNSEARYAAGRGVMMRDADKQIDLRSVSTAKLAIWSKGWCKNYEDARFEYMAGNVGAAGTAIVGPFREEINIPPGPWTPDGYGVGLGYAPEYGYQGTEYGRYR